jgi:hypothetical protein
LKKAGLSLLPVKRDGQLLFEQWKAGMIFDTPQEDYGSVFETSPLKYRQNPPERNKLDEPLPTVTRLLKLVIAFFLILNMFTGYETIQKPGGCELFSCMETGFKL